MCSQKEPGCRSGPAGKTNASVVCGTLSHDGPHTDEKHTHTHTHAHPIKALGQENVTFQRLGTEERLTCLHCDDEATRRRTFLQAHAALAGIVVRECYDPPPPAHTPVLQVISGWTVTGQEVTEGLSESHHCHTYLTFPSLFPDERFLVLKARLVFPLFSIFLSSPLPQHPCGSLSCPPTLSPLVSLAFTFCPCSLHFFPPLLPPFVLPPHSCAEAD